MTNVTHQEKNSCREDITQCIAHPKPKQHNKQTRHQNVALRHVVWVLLALTPSMHLNADQSPSCEQLISKDSPYDRATYCKPLQSFLLTTNEQFDSEKNFATWQALERRAPDDLLIKAYANVSDTLIGRDSFFPWNRMKHTEAGLVGLDRIMRKISKRSIKKKGFFAPVDMEIRLLVGTTYTVVPNIIFSTHQDGINILEGLLSDARFASSPDGFKAAALMNVAKYYDAENVKPEKVKRYAKAILALRDAPKTEKQFAQNVLRDKK